MTEAIVEYRKGCVVDAFLNNETYIFAHGANCQKTMASGVAKVVRNKLSELYTVDQVSPLSPERRLGDVTYWDFPHPTLSCKIGFNLYTQLYYGTQKRHVNYGAVSHAFNLLGEHVRDYAFDVDLDMPPVIGIPKIGAGLGGGDWDTILEIAKFYLYDCHLCVYLK